MDNDMQKCYLRLIEIIGEVDDLNRAEAILEWDRETYMPNNGGEWRGIQASTLKKISHEKFTSSEVGNLIEKLNKWAEDKECDIVEVRVIRTVTEQYRKMKKLPAEFVKNKAKLSNEAYLAWLKAREENNYSIFSPFLEKIVDKSKEEAVLLGYTGHILDPLIDQTDKGMTADMLEAIFNPLKIELSKITSKIRESKKEIRVDFLNRFFDPKKQMESSKIAIRRIGFDFECGRLDEVIHPFCTTFSPSDVRITTKVAKHDPTSCFFSCLHEAGHAMYEMNMPRKYFRTPMYEGATSGIHESQSRMWENLVGRSYSFWENFYPEYAKLFPECLNDVSVYEWYCAINRVNSSYIRVESDEVTYNLHIMLRFELEKAVMDDKLKVKDLEDAYNSGLKQLLDLPAPSPNEGIIQDIHWTELFGSGYQGYTIGNLCSAQFFKAANRFEPRINQDLKAGKYESLLEWFKENVYKHGAYYNAQRLLELSTGSNLDSKYYLDYIKEKYSNLYEIEL